MMFEFLTSGNIKNVVFGNVATCILIDRYHYFGGM